MVIILIIKRIKTSFIVVLDYGQSKKYFGLVLMLSNLTILPPQAFENKTNNTTQAHQCTPMLIYEDQHHHLFFFTKFTVLMMFGQVGSIFDAEGDKQQAYQYHFDRYTYHQVTSL